MEKEIIKTVTFTSYFKDFTGDVRGWQEAYFELLSWKNTYYIPYEMDINSTSSHEAYLYLVVKEEVKETTKNILENLGYGNIQIADTKTLEITLDVDLDIDNVKVFMW